MTNNDLPPQSDFLPKDVARIAAIADKTKRGLYVMALISEKVSGIKPVIVGGFAMEFYSTGGYRTSDVDALYLYPEAIGRLLEQLGFIKRQRHWVSEAYDLLIEFPGHAIEARARERLTDVSIDGKIITLIGIEDLILDRLNGFVQFHSTDDRHWARELLVMYHDHLDLNYLRQQSAVDKTDVALEALLTTLPPVTP